MTTFVESGSVKKASSSDNDQADIASIEEAKTLGAIDHPNVKNQKLLPNCCYHSKLRIPVYRGVSSISSLGLLWGCKDC